MSLRTAAPRLAREQRVDEILVATGGKQVIFDALLARWHAPLIIGIRFMYGFRILGPIMLGMGRVESWKFIVFNFIGAAIWGEKQANSYAEAAFETQRRRRPRQKSQRRPR